LIPKKQASWALVAHAYNPSYSGDRDQLDRGSKPAWQIVCETLSLKYLTQKMAGGVTQSEDPEFKPQYHKKKKKKVKTGFFFSLKTTKKWLVMSSFKILRF
jgi:hypothetical protein